MTRKLLNSTQFVVFYTIHNPFSVLYSQGPETVSVTPGLRWKPSMRQCNNRQQGSRIGVVRPKAATIGRIWILSPTSTYLGVEVSVLCKGKITLTSVELVHQMEPSNHQLNSCRGNRTRIPWDRAAPVIPILGSVRCAILPSSLVTLVMLLMNIAS